MYRNAKQLYALLDWLKKLTVKFLNSGRTVAMYLSDKRTLLSLVQSLPAARRKRFVRVYRGIFPAF